MKSNVCIGLDNKCSGCTACFNICSTKAISMCRNVKGFLYPVIDKQKCINCTQCMKYCPWLVSYTNKEQKNEFYAAKRIDFRKRMQSQSGGAFAVFAEHILNNNGVVYGVSFKNNVAFYTRVTKARNLKHLKKSKYLQAEVNDVYYQVFSDLNKSKKVLFAGTSCHVDGLKKYLAYKKVNTTTLITIDIVCHGVVSPLFFEKYISYIEELHGKKVKSFNFRDKSFGWHGHIITYKMGASEYKTKDYVRIFYSSYALRETCYQCQYSNLSRISDITIGDCWGINTYYPDFDDNKGCSLIIINSNVGKELFNWTKKEFEYLKLDKEMALQPNLCHPTEKPEDYDMFWSDYNKYGFEYVIYKYCNVDPLNDSVVLRKKQLFRRIIFKLKRMLGQE